MRPFVFASFSFVLTASACTYRTEETVLASTETPLRASIVRVDRSQVDAICAGGHGGGFCVPELRRRTNVLLHVEKSPRATLRPEGCTETETGAQLLVSPDSSRVAWKCSGTWRFAYLGTAGRAFPAGVAPLAGSSVSWSTMRPLSDVAAELIETSTPEDQLALYAEVRAGQGDAAVAGLLVRTAHRVIAGSYQEVARGGAWATALAQLPEASRVVVRTGLARRVTEDGPGVTDALLVHAIANDALVAPEHGAVLAARLDELLARGPQWPEALAGGLVAALTRVDPDAAATRGCRMVALRRQNGRPPGRALLAPAVVAIAGATTPCPALATLVAESPCAYGLRCGPIATRDTNPLCSGDSLPATLQPIDPSYGGLVETSTAPGSIEDLALPALARSHTPVPREVTLRNARRLYRIERTDPACPDLTLRELACETAIDQTTATLRTCTITIDDRRRLISLGDARPN